MSETVPLEQLLDEKASMEDEARDLDEEQKQLKERAKALTEKIIEELRKKNDAKQASVNDLQSQVNELEQELGALSAPKISRKAEETLTNPPVSEETAAPLESQPQEAIDDSVSVTEVATEEDVQTESKDKKRRFF